MHKHVFMVNFPWCRRRLVQKSVARYCSWQQPGTSVTETHPFLIHWTSLL